MCILKWGGICRFQHNTEQMTEYSGGWWIIAGCLDGNVVARCELLPWRRSKKGASHFFTRKLSMQLIPLTCICINTCNLTRRCWEVLAALGPDCRGNTALVSFALTQVSQEPETGSMKFLPYTYAGILAELQKPFALLFICLLIGAEMLSFLTFGIRAGTSKEEISHSGTTLQTCGSSPLPPPAFWDAGLKAPPPQ